MSRTTPTSPPPTPPPADAKALDAAPGEKLRNECVGCRLRLNRVSMTRGFNDADKGKIATALGLTAKRAVSGGHKIYDDTVEAIKLHNDLLGRVEKYWKGMTLPLAAVNTDEVATEGGVRLVRRDHAEEFHNRMLAFRSEAETVVRRMNHDRPQIIAAARELLGDKFDAHQYPEEFVIGVYWGFPAVDVPSYLEQMAPAAFEHERRLVHQRFEQTYELATTSLLEEFHAVIGSWVAALGPVTRIYPDEGHPLAHLHGAEVFRSEGHADDPAVPEGKVRLTLRFNEQGKKGLQTQVVGPLTKKEYADLRPSEAVDERRRFQDSTIENLTELVARFRRLGDTVFTAGDDVHNALRRIESQLARCRDAKDAARELRDSQTFRVETHRLMQQLDRQIGQGIVTFRKTRRLVTPLK